MFVTCTSTSEITIHLNDDDRENVEVISRNLNVPPQAIFVLSLADLPAYLDKLAEFAELSTCKHLEKLH